MNLLELILDHIEYLDGDMDDIHEPEPYFQLIFHLMRQSGIDADVSVKCAIREAKFIWVDTTDSNKILIMKAIIKEVSEQWMLRNTIPF